jgi:hypothetical protein
MEMNFREFVATRGFNTSPQNWRMEKSQIMQYWQTLRPDMPIQFNPIESDKKGSTFGEDGIRITGSRPFIDSVLGRLKDILRYENKQTKLNIAYRQVQYKGEGIPDKDSSFVFYIQTKNRETKVPSLSVG